MTFTDPKSQVDRLLGERRPDRYELEGGDGWLDDIADEVEPLIPEAEARAIAARQMVRAREGQKTKAANRVLREVFLSGQPPLDWLDLLNLPIAVGKERIALRAATADDFRSFATDERRRAAADFASRNATCEAAEWLADMMDAERATFCRDLTLTEAAA